jgi:hypothetical protein
MSALGQKQTFAVQNAMSASPPKADICPLDLDDHPVIDDPASVSAHTIST